MLGHDSHLLSGQQNSAHTREHPNDLGRHHHRHVLRLGHYPDTHDLLNDEIRHGTRTKSGQHPGFILPPRMAPLGLPVHLLAVGLHHLLAGLEHRGHTRTHPVLGQLHKRSRQTHGRRLRLATLLRLRRLLDFIAMRLRVELPHDMDHDGFLLRLR